MEWNEPYLMRYPFRHGAKRQAAEARLGFPREDCAHPGEWVCSFQIHNLDDDRIRGARGEDGLQAMVIASDAIRKQLDKLSRVSSDREPYEVVFPRYVPFCLGLAFHRKLCRLVDAEVNAKQKQAAKRRSARKR